RNDKATFLLLRVIVEVDQRIGLQVAPAANAVRFADVTHVPLYANEITPDKPFTLKLRHFAGRQEVWLDKRRLLCLPAARRPERVGFSIYNAGSDSTVKVEFNAMSPVAGAAQPAQAPVKKLGF